jgi:polygalacturonase
LSSNIKFNADKNIIIFSIPGPGKYYVQVDSLPPLFVFANSVEKNNISPDNPRVHYFGPGVHKPGYITVKDSETVYIAAGAIVYGGIRANGVKNISVVGRGILDGNFEFKQMVQVENCKNVLFEGVMIRNGDGWTNTLINCDGVKYNHVKVLSFGPAGDGIDILGSRNVVITNCFLRCTDDCIAIKAPAADQSVKDVMVADNTMIGFAFSDGVTIGFETNAESISNITVRNCDVILARGGSRVDGHSGFSIICDGPAIISNVLYDNIRVEKSEIKLFELNITDGTKYGSGPPGHIENIKLKNISWAHQGPIVLKGFDDKHRVQKVTFENCTVAGKPLRDIKTNVMQIGKFVDDVIVE